MGGARWQSGGPGQGRDGTQDGPARQPALGGRFHFFLSFDRNGLFSATFYRLYRSDFKGWLCNRCNKTLLNRRDEWIRTWVYPPAASHWSRINS
jgi:hypothetical protein